MPALGEREGGNQFTVSSGRCLLCQAVGHSEGGELSIWDQTRIRACNTSVKGGTECSRSREQAVADCLLGKIS